MGMTEALAFSIVSDALEDAIDAGTPSPRAGVGGDAEPSPSRRRRWHGPTARPPGSPLPARSVGSGAGSGSTTCVGAGSTSPRQWPTPSPHRLQRIWRTARGRPATACSRRWRPSSSRSSGCSARSATASPLTQAGNLPRALVLAADERYIQFDLKPEKFRVRMWDLFELGELHELVTAKR